MRVVKILGIGVLNFLARFAMGGALFLAAEMDPIGFLYGFFLTATAFTASFLLMRFVMKPATIREAMRIAVVWMCIAFLLDVLTAEPIVHVEVASLFSEPQFWTRLLAILLGVWCAVPKEKISQT